MNYNKRSNHHGTGKLLVISHGVRNEFYFYAFAKTLLLIFLMVVTTIKLFSQVQLAELSNKVLENEKFIENKGQINNQFKQKNEGVKYLLHAKGLNVQLKRNSFSYDTYEILSKPSVSSSHNFINSKMKSNNSTTYRIHRIDIQFTGANPLPQIEAKEKSGNYANYYISNNKEAMKVYNYGMVIYKEIYPGIDLIFDTKNTKGKKGFEYYFIVKPGADANQIKLKYNGAETNLENEKIIINTTNGKVEESIPCSFFSKANYTELKQIQNEPAIKVFYKAIGKGLYKFSFSAYDKTKTLVIDPTPDLVWGTYYGGINNDWAHGINIDPTGNILIGGASDNANFATSGAYQTTLVGFGDAMIGKFTSNGKLLWMTYFGGEQEENATDICSDSNGNIFVAGETFSKTGIATAGSFQTIPGDIGGSMSDAFVAKFNASGNRIWATYYGGIGGDGFNAIKADINGNIFVAGTTFSANGISSPGALQITYGSGPLPQDGGDGFIARFDNNGNRIWGTYYGGKFNDGFADLAIDNIGNLYVSGDSNSDGLASLGAFQTTNNGSLGDVLIVKLDKNGNRIWATYYGGEKGDANIAITSDTKNNIIIAGWTASTGNIATPGVYLPSFAGGNLDGYVVKFNESGNRIWGTYYGGAVDDLLYGITSDLNDDIIITGLTNSTNNIATSNAYQTSLPVNGTGTTFIAKLNSTGSRLWGTYYGYGNLYGGGNGEDAVTDNSGNIFVCGETVSPNGIATCDAVQQTWGGNQDMFIAMFSETIISSTVSVTISSGQDTAVCSGVPVTFTAVPLNGGTNPIYQWKVNGNNAGTNSSVFTTTSLNNGDQVNCAVSSNSPCISNPLANSNVIKIVIRPSLIPAVNISSSVNGPICNGSSVTFTAASLNGGNTPVFNWKINGANTGANDSIFITTRLVNGDVVTCELINANSCNAITSAISNSIVATVQSTITPSITIASSVTDVCEGKPITFTATALNAGNNPAYQWKVNGTLLGNNLTYTTSSLFNNDTVQCFLIPDNISCVSSQNIASNKMSMQIYAPPNFSIEPNHPIISEGDTVQLSVVGTNILIYKWTPAKNISNDAINNPKVWPENTETYILEATSGNGCVADKEVVVTVISKIYVPNAFTPNNDGLNDYWVIKGLSLYPKCKVSIFNRYGELIYQSLGYTIPWNGKNKNGLLLNGSFVYKIDFEDGTKPLSGSVIIVR